MWRWVGPILAGIAGFFAGFIPAAFIFVALGGLDPAHNLGISDELVNYLAIIAGACTAAIGASLAAGCRLAQFALVLAIALGIASAALIVVFLVADVTTGPGAGLMWVAILLTVLVTGVSARLLQLRASERPA